MHDRRQWIETVSLASLFAGLGVFSGSAHADLAEAMAADYLPELAKAFGASAPVLSKEVKVHAPEIAENGASVRIGAETSLPHAKVSKLLLFVERNPQRLVSVFTPLSSKIKPEFHTDAKFGQSSPVVAMVITQDGKALYASQEVKVTAGGC